MRNIWMKLFGIWPSYSGADVDLSCFLFSALVAIFFIGVQPLGNFGEGLMRNVCDFGPVVREEISFKGFHYSYLWLPFCLV